MLYKKNRLSLFVLIFGIFVLAACGGSPEVEEAAPPEEDTTAEETAAEEPAAEESTAETVQVALLLPGPITDGGWDQLAYEGLEELKQQEGFDGAFTENIGQADIAEITRGYADDGYDLIIGHGFEFGSAFLEIAPDYSEQNFFATTFQPQDEIPSNIQYIDAAYYDAAYAAGALAALISDSNVVGFVGGGDNPTQRGMMNAFITGAENTVPGTTGLGVVTGDYNDAAKGRESAITMIGNGADVIWHAADVTGLGAIEGGVSSDVKVLGAYSDQTGIAPEHMGASLVMDLNQMVQKLGQDVRNDTFAAGEEWRPSVSEMWHWSAGESDHNSDIIPDDVWETYMEIWNDLDAGNIDYPINTE